MNNTNTLLINKEKFIDWYFSDETATVSPYEIATTLKGGRNFVISAEELLDDVGYLPVSVAEENQKLVLDQFNEDEIDMGAYKEIKFS